MDMKKSLYEAATAVLDGGRGLLAGYVKTAQATFTRPITEQYPEEKRILPARSRARIILTRSPDGDERCVACYLCSAACPVSCISMESATRDDGRRYAAWFRIDFGRCIYCGFCEEACPTLAIQLTPNFEFSATDMLNLVAEKEDLLKGTGGKHPHYDFYAHAGVAEKSPKGTHENEKPVVDYRTNLP
ncbi:NADH-quinone oxidoreductase subunit NuoI [Desulfovibrio inopinatus]|uniref:NADH-quinone oxidoreductase subunit NuoI n=1 Tax=Desulfovibrio inopinatus TaxID=102109 RepID=UPI0004021562|nr:NADH-quinone oxidoreductase subunit NuoI [Desulfovibrio inopinatus]